MSGNLVIPNVFVGSSPSLISRLDVDLATIATYINVREITFDLLANLPAQPQPHGAGFFATDAGLLFGSDGATWWQLGAGVNAVALGLYGSRGLLGQNNPGTPNTKFDFAADMIQLIDPNTLATSVLKSVATQTCDITVAGPAINGRDQAGAFVNGSWVYFYELLNVNTAAKGLIASASPWPAGPALPAGYTRWAPLHAVYLSAGGALTPLLIRGRSAFYKDAPNVFNGLSGTVENTQSIPALIPPNCSEMWLDWDCFAAAGEGPSFKWAAGHNYAPYPSTTTGTQSGQTRVPNVGQAFLWQIITNSRQTIINLDSYSVPNGAD